MSSLAQQAQAIADSYIPKPTGTHSAITDDAKVQIFLEAVQDGCYIETAAKLAGLAKQTIYNWVKRAEQGEIAFASFVDALQKAEARAEADAIRNVRQAGKLPQFWAAEMTYLERRHPDRWGKRQDDSNTPKVVVNIGVGQGDVRVGVALSPGNINDLPCGNQGQVEMLSPINRNYVNQLEPAIESVPAVTSSSIEHADPGGRIDQGTLPGGGGLSSPRKAASVKGRSFQGRARKKKGSVEP